MNYEYCRYITINNKIRLLTKMFFTNKTVTDIKNFMNCLNIYMKINNEDDDYNEWYNGKRIKTFYEHFFFNINYRNIFVITL